jgi:MYXO-CTERM domain-containing protein
MPTPGSSPTPRFEPSSVSPIPHEDIPFVLKPYKRPAPSPLPPEVAETIEQGAEAVTETAGSIAEGAQDVAEDVLAEITDTATPWYKRPVAVVALLALSGLAYATWRRRQRGIIVGQSSI